MKNRILIASHPGGPDVLTMAELPLPQPGPHDILIKVAAAGVNRPDVLQRKGLYPPPPGAPEGLGLECAGTVEAVGSEVSRWKVGDAVCALLAGGGYADYALAHEALALPVPPGWSLIEAAAAPETVFTVWSNVFERGRLQKGETLLVHGGASGIGTTAIQLVKSFGAQVIATAGSEAKRQACLTLGADLAIDYRTEDFVQHVKAFNGRGANVILDMVGGDYIARNLEAAAPDGRIVQIAFLRGSKVEIDLMRIMLKRLTFTGSTLRSRKLEEKAAIARAVEQNVWPMADREGFKPLIHAVLPLTEAAQAHRMMEANEVIGKVVLVP